MNNKYEVSGEELDSISQRKLNKWKEVIEGYILRGRLLKQVGDDIQPFLPGVVCGLVAEVLSEDSVNIFKLDRSAGVKAIPFLSWRGGVITESRSTRGMNLEYILPEGKSKGMFLSKTNRVCIPLQA